MTSHFRFVSLVARDPPGEDLAIDAPSPPPTEEVPPAMKEQEASERRSGEERRGTQGKAMRGVEKRGGQRRGEKGRKGRGWVL